MSRAATKGYGLPRGRAVHFLRAAGRDEDVAAILEADSVSVEITGGSYQLKTYESGIFYRNRTEVVAEGEIPGSYGLSKISEVGEAL